MARKATPTPTPEQATPATPTPEQATPATPEQATPATPASTVTPVAPAIEAAAVKAFAALGKVEAAAGKAIARTRSEQLPATLDAWSAFGAALKPVVDASDTLAWENVTGTGLFKAVVAGLISEASRALLPDNATAYGKAVAIAKHDTAARRSAFLKAGNVPDSDEYLVWLNLTATLKAGSNRSTVDIKASLLKPEDWDDTANDGKGAPKPGAAFGRLVRGGAARGAGAGGSSNPVPAPIANVLKLRDKRDKLAAVPVVAALNIPAEKWDGFVAQVIAQYLLQHVAAPADGAPAITITVG